VIEHRHTIKELILFMGIAILAAFVSVCFLRR
jgi:hypothetical protein